MKDVVWSYTAKSTVAVVNTDGTRMLGELLEETSDLGLAYKEKSLLCQIEEFCSKCDIQSLENLL